MFVKISKQLEAAICTFMPRVLVKVLDLTAFV